MKAVYCLALLAAVAVIGTRGETCHGTDTNTCTHENCSGDVNGVYYVVVCHSGQCTCEVSNHNGNPICTTDADCHNHCAGGHGGHGGHHPHTHVVCDGGKCHCRH